MEVIDRIGCFEVELEYIKDEKIRKSIEKLLELLPDYFFSIPASSTGKYHPKFSLGDGGLVRHVKVAVRIAKELLDNPLIGDKYSEKEKDLIIGALILHDGLKSGKEYNRYTKVEHPTLMKNFIIENKESLFLSDDDLKLLARLIEAHMGSWNKDYDGNSILPIPKDKCENFVHMCDFLSSRKFLDVSFIEGKIEY